MDPSTPRDHSVVRGRIVMLVDNGVIGDSRVQKAAESAAAAGWEVFLLGRSNDGKPHSWMLGEAEVRLLPMPSPLSKRPHEYRRSWWRRPFAYPPNGIAAYREQWAKARLDDLRAYEAAHGIRQRAGARGLRFAIIGGWQRFLLRRAESRVGWVAFRTRQTNEGLRARKRMDTLPDRLYEYFWRAIMGKRSWRRLEPRLLDFEMAFGKTIDRLKPDLIHANDFYMIGVGARAMLRARAKGRPVKLVWDAHELVSGLKPRADNVRWLRAHCNHEREYVPFADAAMTVSTELAELLQRHHGLKELPSVVLNAPTVATSPPDSSAPNLRRVCGLPSHVPLLVYSGAAAPQRGLDTIVEALPGLPGVHAAFVVANPASKYIQGLLAKATELGVRNRVHTAPYVSHEHIVTYLSSATIGVIPIHHWPNHEIALITKFFEYAHAGLPVVVSDVRAMANATESIGHGEVFRAGDTLDFVRATAAVLADPARYVENYQQPGLLASWTWEAQAAVLDDVYSRLLEGVSVSRQRRTVVPDVSVVLAVHNAMPYLAKCIRSLMEQSIDFDRMEVVAIDDGSTDGSGTRLDSFARLYPDHFRVVHQDSSGGPAAPYNRALELARGRYVLFLGADDYLGPEALERMVAAADEHESDIVLGKWVGANLRNVPGNLFAESNMDVDLSDPATPFVLSNAMLFRRELLQRHAIRYAEDMMLGTDEPFALLATLHAERVSVLADYDYYHVVRRRDGSNRTLRAGAEQRLSKVERVMRLAAQHTEAGALREAVHLRYFATEVVGLLQGDLLQSDEAEQKQICARVGLLADLFLTDSMLHSLAVASRVRIVLARLGRIADLLEIIDRAERRKPYGLIVENGRIYRLFPGFRDPLSGLPDSVFEVTEGPAEAVALNLSVASMSWADGSFRLALRSDIDLSHFGPIEFKLSAGSVHGYVDAQPTRDGLIHAQLPVVQLLSEIPSTGGRQEIKMQVAAGGATYETPIPMQASAKTIKHFRGRRHQMFRIKPITSRQGNIVLETVPINTKRVIGKIRYEMRTRNEESDY